MHFFATANAHLIGQNHAKEPLSNNVLLTACIITCLPEAPQERITRPDDRLPHIGYTQAPILAFEHYINLIETSLEEFVFGF